MYLIGIDIGGTKTAVILGKTDNNGQIDILERIAFKTISGSNYQQTLNKIESIIHDILQDYQMKPKDITAIGISCGGPLDSTNGLILSPPNLPGWDQVAVVNYFEQKFGIPTKLQNDANAGALAEWHFGAGKGTKNMIFLTFGTGFGAGLILNNQLYAGASDMAGEIGHVRLTNEGPVGYGKRGSYEGYCSGGGIAQLATMMALEKQQQGEKVAWFEDEQGVSAKTVAEAAAEGDPLAQQVYQEVGNRLGQGLSVLIDILNPEKIVIGSIYVRQHQVLAPIVAEVIEREALPLSSKVCEVVPAGLGEEIGDFAALSIAYQQVKEGKVHE